MLFSDIDDTTCNENILKFQNIFSNLNRFVKKTLNIHEIKSKVWVNNVESLISHEII